MLQGLFYLTTALHVSGVTITHLQDHKTTVTAASGNHYTVLLSAAIMEELEQVLVHSNSVVVRGRSGRTDHDQQHCYHHVPAVNQMRPLQFINS
jgi:hypothetical protein